MWIGELESQKDKPPLIWDFRQYFAKEGSNNENYVTFLLTDMKENSKNSLQV